MSWLRTGIKKQKAGEVIEARTIRETTEAAEWASKIRVSAPLEMINTGAGPLIRLAQKPLSGCWYCEPSSGVTGATGAWPSLTMISFTADVYQSTNGNLNIVASSATIWNGYPASLAANKVCFVMPDGAGDWNVVAQSCT